MLNEVPPEFVVRQQPPDRVEGVHKHKGVAGAQQPQHYLKAVTLEHSWDYFLVLPDGVQHLKQPTHLHLLETPLGNFAVLHVCYVGPFVLRITEGFPAVRVRVVEVCAVVIITTITINFHSTSFSHSVDIITINATIAIAIAVAFIFCCFVFIIILLMLW